jgi:endonuclease G
MPIDTEAPAVQLGHRPQFSELSKLGGDDAAHTESIFMERAEVERAARPRISPPERFAGRIGFSEDHLAGFKVELPSPNGAKARDVLPVGGDLSGRLDYLHFSVVMSGSRKIAMFVGVNIEGNRSVSIVRENDKWFLDGRIPLDAQIGEFLYARNRLDRGHLVRREDPNWGDDAEVANADTFHFTNCSPQMDIVNQRTWAWA